MVATSVSLLDTPPQRGGGHNVSSAASSSLLGFLLEVWGVAQQRFVITFVCNFGPTGQFRAVLSLSQDEWHQLKACV